MSRNTKNLVIILIAAIVFCILGVVAAIGGAGLLADRFTKQNIATEPDKVQKMANEFINYQLPANYVEKMGIDFVVYKMVLFGEASDVDANGSTKLSKPIIFLTHFQTTQGMTPEEMTKQMQKSIEQQSDSKGISFKIVETRNITIDGEEVPLTVSEGEDPSGRAYRQWISTFAGKSGMVILIIQGKVSDWDEASYNEFLSSLSIK